MKKITHKFNKASKILLLLFAVMALQKVNVVNQNEKVVHTNILKHHS